jgi:hypothetical protein
VDVPLTISGAAENGVDYDFVSPLVSFPAGVSSIQFDVDTLTASGVPSNLPVNATFDLIEDKTRYAVADPGGASILIISSLADQWDAYEVWQAVNIPSGPGDFTGNADGDDLLNGLEYVYGTDPTALTTDPLAGKIQIADNGGFIEIRLTTISPMTDISLAIEASSDIPSDVWSDETGQFQLTVVNLASPFVERTYTSLAPAAADSLTYRLRITQTGGQGGNFGPPDPPPSEPPESAGGEPPPPPPPSVYEMLIQFLQQLLALLQIFFGLK